MPAPPRAESSLELLDNPIWNALTGRHANFAEGGAHARRYQPEVTMLAAMPEPCAEGCAELRGLLGAEGAAGLFFAAEPSLPANWNLFDPGRLAQMVCRRPVTPIDDPGIVSMTPADVDEMMALTALTKPGPFGRRTIELGGYRGLRVEGRLAAMGGQRMQVGNFTEVSAVCTHPDFRGRGYAAALVSAIAADIQQRGETPFLHVLANNDTAISVYRKLGFEIRRTFHLRVVLPEGAKPFV